MRELRFELTGWRAITAGVIILSFPLVRFSSRFPNVSDDGRETVRAWLVEDYEGRSPAKLAQVVSDYQAGLSLHLPTRPAVAPRVELVSVKAHGRSNAMIVRVEVTVDGGPPSDGRSVRYLYLTTKVGGGWMVLSESDSYRYYEALFG